MSQFIVTFGSGHHPYGNGYTLVEAGDIQDARTLVFASIGTHFCSVEPISYLPEMQKYRSPFFEWKAVRANPPRSAHQREEQEC